jgi:hypothetical protein
METGWCQVSTLKRGEETCEGISVPPGAFFLAEPVEEHPIPGDFRSALSGARCQIRVCRF